MFIYSEPILFIYVNSKFDLFQVDREVRRKRSEWRITKMVLIIFIAFIITYLPITLVKSFDHDANYPGTFSDLFKCFTRYIYLS